MSQPALDLQTSGSRHGSLALVAPATETLENALRRAAPSEGPLAEAVAYHLAQPGKLARGRLAQDACAALGVHPAEALELAVACELLHNASLVHDDLQDRDALRRGQLTVWRRYGDAVAVCVGDYLLTEALDRAARIAVSGPGPRRELARCFTAAVRTTLNGQTRDVLAARGGALAFGDYCSLARDKTAPLLALPVDAALLLAGEGPAARAAVRTAMEGFGLAYQIQDDLLEVFGRKERESVPGGIRFDRPNAVVSLHLEALAGPERAAFERFLDTRMPESAGVAWAQRLRAVPSVGRAIAAAQEARVEGTSRLDRVPAAVRGLLEDAADRMLRPLDALRVLHAGREARS